MKKGIILAIESSCDDTGVAILKDGQFLLSNLLASQIDFHREFGGVVPEIASRKHLEVINLLISKALEESGIKFSDIDAVAATKGPGLVGALLVGVCTAKSIAFACDIPFIGVNHLMGHIYANFLTYPELAPPFVIMLVSGGHTEIIYMKDYSGFEILGSTLDDAAGEAFDKGARVLGLPYPGGPAIQKIAADGNDKFVKLPQALKGKNNFNFSFSGLKTSLLYYMNENPSTPVCDAAASYQNAIVSVLVDKSFNAARKMGVNRILFAGGVAANKILRDRAFNKASKWGYEVYFPSVSECTDNAAMIAKAGWHKFSSGEIDGLDCNVYPSLSLNDK